MLLWQAVELREKYRIIVREENYENEKTNRIFELLGTLIMFETESEIGRQSDLRTFGEFSRRKRKAMVELQTLLGE